MRTSTATRDGVERPSEPVLECQPRRMAMVAALAGLLPPALHDATVVELHCGAAANLLAIAAAFPSVTAVGVDPSDAAIARGRALAQGAALGHVELVSGAEVPLADGQADFVIVDGVLSSLGAAGAASLLAEAARVARDGGLVVLGFDADPGALPQLLTRALGRRGIEPQRAAIDPSQAKVALLARLELASTSSKSRYAKATAVQLERARQREASELVHQELAPSWSPIAVAELATQAQTHDLHYVGEVIAADRWRLRMPLQVIDEIARLVGPSASDQQQHIDDMTGAAVHRSLFVKGAQARPPAAPAAPELWDAFPAERWHVTAQPPSEADVQLSKERQLLLDAVRDGGAAGREIGDVAAALGVPPQTALQVASTLDAYGLLTLTAAAPPAATEPGRLPVASSLARAQVQAGADRVTSLLHRSVALPDDLPGRALLPLLDGTRDRAALADALTLAGHLTDGTDASEVVDACLAALCQAGLLRATDRDAAAQGA